MRAGSAIPAADDVERGSGRMLSGAGVDRVPSASRSIPRRNPVADKSPKKSTNKTAAAKTLKEKRVEKKDKAAGKRRSE
jgi:hypothetical protein